MLIMIGEDFLLLLTSFTCRATGMKPENVQHRLSLSLAYNADNATAPHRHTCRGCIVSDISFNGDATRQCLPYKPPTSNFYISRFNLVRLPNALSLNHGSNEFAIGMNLFSPRIPDAAPSVTCLRDLCPHLARLTMIEHWSLRKVRSSV